MEQVLGLRPFVPARDFSLSKHFYEAVGFAATFEDKQIAILRLGAASFILQDFYVQAFAENLMLQLAVRDLDGWWGGVDADRLVADFSVKAPIAPAMQNWGMRVGFLFDPSGVLWHVTEVPS